MEVDLGRLLSNVGSCSWPIPTIDDSQSATRVDTAVVLIPNLDRTRRFDDNECFFLDIIMLCVRQAD